MGTAEQEREAVVAWLRKWAELDGRVYQKRAYYEAANFIERGHHLSRNPDNPRK